jgi:hypothetical protein
MKTLSMIILLFIVPIVVKGQNYKALDEKYGFREAKFGMPFHSFKKLVMSYDQYIDSLYEVTDADLHIGDYTLDKISYKFYKGQLYLIKIIVNKDYINTLGIIKVLEKAYGKANWPRNDYCEWKGEKVTMTFCFIKEVPSCIILKSNKMDMDMLKEFESKQQQKLENAAKKL